MNENKDAIHPIIFIVIGVLIGCMFCLALYSYDQGIFSDESTREEICRDIDVCECVEMEDVFTKLAEYDCYCNLEIDYRDVLNKVEGYES